MATKITNPRVGPMIGLPRLPLRKSHARLAAADLPYAGRLLMVQTIENLASHISKDVAPKQWKDCYAEKRTIQPAHFGNRAIANLVAIALMHIATTGRNSQAQPKLSRLAQKQKPRPRAALLSQQRRRWTGKAALRRKACAPKGISTQGPGPVC